jgi:hypothetical protein
MDVSFVEENNIPYSLECHFPNVSGIRGAPVFSVLKKNGKLRMIVNYRHLNDIAIRDSYLLPLINEMFEHLS